MRGDKRLPVDRKLRTAPRAQPTFADTSSIAVLERVNVGVSLGACVPVSDGLPSSAGFQGRRVGTPQNRRTLPTFGGSTSVTPMRDFSLVALRLRLSTDLPFQRNFQYCLLYIKSAEDRQKIHKNVVIIAA